MVVAIHARGYFALEPEIEAVLEPVVTLIAVPIFFLCDGFLFVKSRRREAAFDYPRFIRRSARRLVVPWVAFSALYVAARYLFEASGILSSRVVLGRTPVDLLVGVYGSAVAPQLYFLLSLFLIRLCGLALRPLASLPVAGLWMLQIACAAAYFAILGPALRTAIPIELDPLRHAVWGLQYFLLGALLARLEGPIGRCAGLLFVVSVALGAVVRLVDAPGIHPALFQYAYLLAAYFGARQWLAQPSLLSRIGQNSMGIYLLHTPVVLKAMALLMAASIGKSLLGYSVAVFLSAAFAHVVALLLARSSVGRILLGESR